MKTKYDKIHYQSYLKLDQILEAQEPRSRHYGKEAHDETLFIVVHQVYELWFFQLNHELQSILKMLDQNLVKENHMSVVNHRLDRMNKIVCHLINQIDIIETMLPLDFLDFREMLIPASGFQSFQFRQFETRLGLPSSSRLTYNSQSYMTSLKQEHQEKMSQIESENSLFKCVQNWLSRTPFLKMADFDFWNFYQSAVDQMLEREILQIEENSFLSSDEKIKNQSHIKAMKEGFATLFCPETFAKAQTNGIWRMDQKAIHAALFIQIYSDHPVLQQPARMLTQILELDERLTLWRYRHALMAKRMLGSRLGTGGSTGHDYLKSATEKHKVFSDLNQLTTYLIPRGSLPALPKDLILKLKFFYEVEESLAPETHPPLSV